MTRWTLLDGLSLRDGPLPKEDSLLVIVFESHPSYLKLLALLVEDLDEIGFDCLRIKVLHPAVENHEGAARRVLSSLCHALLEYFLRWVGSKA